MVSYIVPIAAWSGSDASRSAGVIREWGFAVPTPVGHVGCVCPASSATRRARSGCRRRGMPLARASAGLSGSELQVAPRSAVWKPAAGCPALNRLEASCVFCLHRAVGSAAECDDAMRGEARTKKAGLRCCRLAVSIVRRSVAVVVCGTVTCAVATAFKISTRWQQYLQFTRGQHVVVFASKVKVSKD